MASRITLGDAQLQQAKDGSWGRQDNLRWPIHAHTDIQGFTAIPMSSKSFHGFELLHAHYLPIGLSKYAGSRVGSPCSCSRYPLPPAQLIGGPWPRRDKRNKGEGLSCLK
ncbi:hypothetical protein J3F83DRAFT_408197 [Trichoderma novae-zelandiae]